MVGIVLVSRSARLAGGLARLVGEVAGPDVRVEPAGASDVAAAIGRADSGAGVVVMADLDPAVTAARAAVGGRAATGLRLADAPFVEGAVAAAVTAATGQPLAAVTAAAEEARGARKR